VRLVQIAQRSGQRRVAVVDGRHLQLVRGHGSVYALAQEALASGASLADTVERTAGGETLEYDPIYEGTAEWRLLPAMDQPGDPARCLVSGTGLTHMRSAANRQAMHAAGAAPTDSMRMYEWGVEGGRPAEGLIGTAPEWFYKGSGSVLRAHGEPLEVPPHAEDGGEEPELAGVYVVDPQGMPRRIGMAAGNEFSDHITEKRNYLYLAASKLMSCALGPELVLDPNFHEVHGEVSILRSGRVIWSKPIRSGDSAMSHSLSNIEHHHFKHAGHRRPGDVHIHFFGADAFSFGESVTLADGDVMQVSFDGFGRPLHNPVRIDRSAQTLYAAEPL
jgi:hypothetical protein